VIYPPVAVNTFHNREAEDYYLAVSELVPYKRLDVAVRCFSRSGRRLRIVGDGPEFRRLRALAAPNVQFLGRVGGTELRDCYARCRALIMPGEEDFGITAVEALASGKPVIALARGGALETAPAEYLFPEATEDSLESALSSFESNAGGPQPAELQRLAQRFAPAEFERKMRELLELPVTRSCCPEAPWEPSATGF